MRCFLSQPFLLNNSKLIDSVIQNSSTGASNNALELASTSFVANCYVEHTETSNTSTTIEVATSSFLRNCTSINKGSGIGIDEEKDFFVSKWDVDKKKVDPLLKSIKKSDEIFLALDPDREGELIAWHLIEICKEKKIYDGKHIFKDSNEEYKFNQFILKKV